MMNKTVTIGNRLFTRTFVEEESILVNHNDLGNGKSCFNYQGVTDDREGTFKVPYAGMEQSFIADGELNGAHDLFQFCFADEKKGLTIKWNFRFFENTAGYECAYDIEAETVPRGDWSQGDREDRLDIIPFDLDGVTVTLGDFRAATDHHNDFVEISTQTIDNKSLPLFLDGNVLRLEKEDGSGIWIYKISASRYDRRDRIKANFKIDREGVAVMGWGIEPHDFIHHSTLKSNPWVVIPYTDGHSGAIQAARDFFGQYWKRSYNAPGNVMINPWGGGGFYLWNHMHEDWVVEELKAAGRLGGTHYQLDDGWQKGGTLESIIAGRPLNREFWKINKEKFPHDFVKISHAAADNGVKLGLWFCPDCNREYKNWEDEVSILADLHECYNFEYIKIDGAYHRSYFAEENFDNLLRDLYSKTKGQVLFNLDVTAGVRKGFLYSPEFGPLFPANRYPFSPQGAPNKYYPNNTLKNFWKLAHFIPPHLIQVEVPDIFYNPAEDPGEYDKTYPENDCHRPDLYGPFYCGMIAFFGSPLLWLQPSKIKEELLCDYASVIKLFKQYRNDIVQGLVMPIGDEPDGTGITGFISQKESSGYLLIFREVTEQCNATIPIPMLNDANTEVIFSNTNVQAELRHGQFDIKLDDMRSFALLSYQC
jgi:hypothetical protein